MTGKATNLSVRLHEDELKEVKQNAKDKGMSLAAYIRHMTIYNVREDK